MSQLSPQEQVQLNASGGRAVSIGTPDGEMDTAVFTPEGEGPFPVVVVYMDAFGLRPALYAVATRLAQAGYMALVPYLFYRSGPMPQMAPATAFGDPHLRAQLMNLISSVTQERSLRDTRALLDWAATQAEAEAQRVATVGYCMGGGKALVAAAHFPEQIQAVAAYHGGRLVTDASDSPHRQVAAIRAKIYIGAADEDGSFTEADGETLRAALEAAGRDFTLEFYRGAHHGYTMSDVPAYNAEANERHWQTLSALLAQALPT